MNLGGWCHIALENGEIHVVPIDDLRWHDAECWCKPVRDIEHPNVVVHNAMDQRERHERGEPLQ